MANNKLSAHALAQERRILNALMTRPMCNNDLALHMGMGRSGAAKYTARMHAAKPKRVHIVGHRAPATGGYPRPIFAAGDGRDAVYVARFPSAPKKTAVDRKGDAMGRIMKELEKGRTAQEIAKASFLAFSTVHKYMDEMHAAGWTIYVRTWRRTGELNQWAPVYAIGNKPDAPRPAPKTRRDFYLAERADPNKVKKHAAGKQRSRMLQQLRAKPNTIFGALGL